MATRSFPLWERGLKSHFHDVFHHWIFVVPLVGTWIEISCPFHFHRRNLVVPLVGTWIEMAFLFYIGRPNGVVPLVGTWIEIGR